ncbi:hypothetical protein BU23DRAFT_222366 [Bimuria novae-zelandiae CBS 107.79]|uniref:Uncharacterized protein n=1 Tax=Bimuria novae-zelandiae CBS 107.79 TaxID=1447943 RepID=A0A6A5VKY2_9PLEO|nr:hypothetical protein BU23DRAFT_222366 [Bimuria novae-zelandiae CBS 107.79]
MFYPNLQHNPNKLPKPMPFKYTASSPPTSFMLPTPPPLLPPIPLSPSSRLFHHLSTSIPSHLLTSTRRHPAPPPVPFLLNHKKTPRLILCIREPVLAQESIVRLGSGRVGSGRVGSSARAGEDLYPRQYRRCRAYPVGVHGLASMVLLGRCRGKVW